MALTDLARFSFSFFSFSPLFLSTSSAQRGMSVMSILSRWRIPSLLYSTVQYVRYGTYRIESTVYTVEPTRADAKKPAKTSAPTFLPPTKKLFFLLLSWESKQAALETLRFARPTKKNLAVQFSSFPFFFLSLSCHCYFFFTSKNNNYTLWNQGDAVCTQYEYAQGKFLKGRNRISRQMFAMWHPYYM